MKVKSETVIWYEGKGRLSKRVGGIHAQPEDVCEGNTGMFVFPLLRNCTNRSETVF